MKRLFSQENKLQLPKDFWVDYISVKCCNIMQEDDEALLATTSQVIINLFYFKFKCLTVIDIDMT